jgi:beta-lactamase regulating signal transducer with metallopeptidase domain
MGAYPTIFDHPLVESVGWTLLHFLWVGAAIAVVVAASLFLLRRRSPQTRYCFAFGALILTAVTPAILLVHLSSLPSEWDADAVALPAPIAQRALLTPSTQPLKLGDLPAVEWSRARVMLPVAATKTAPWLALAWFAIALMACVVELCAWLLLHAAVGRARPLSGACVQRFRAVEQRIGLRRSVQYLLWDVTDVPATVGLVRPAVLIPDRVLTKLSPNMLDALIAHELAHIRRSDYVSNLFQSLIDTTLCFHPAVHWLSQRVRHERENCCDDLAARAISGGAQIYAEALLGIEQLRISAPSIALGAGGGNLVDRIARLLGKRRGAKPATGVAWLLVLCVLLLTAGRVTATTEGVRRSLYEQRARSLSETVYSVLDVSSSPDCGTEVLAALANAMRSMPSAHAMFHAVPEQGLLDQLAIALNHSAAPDTLARQALNRLNVREGWGFDEKPDWPYGTPGQRLILIESLWRAAQCDETLKPWIAIREARAAVLLCAQDYSGIGPATLIRLTNSANTDRLLEIPAERGEVLHNYLVGYERVTRIFLRLYLEAEFRCPSISADSDPINERSAFLEVLRPLAAVSINRPSLQFQLSLITAASDDALKSTSASSQQSTLPLEQEMAPIIGSKSFERWVYEAQSTGLSAHIRSENFEQHMLQ